MATPINEAESKAKREEAAEYGEKKTGRVYFKTREERGKARLYLDFYLCCRSTGFVDDKGSGLKFRRQY